MDFDGGISDRLTPTPMHIEHGTCFDSMHITCPPLRGIFSLCDINFRVAIQGKACN